MGINTQGYGNFNQSDSLLRYDTKAYGAYLSASKNWHTPFGNAGIPLSMNYNFIETSDGDSHKPFLDLMLN